MPTVDGDSAVYAEVFPGVDLRLTATAEGYREVLVVKTPAAAADPRVERIEFGLSSAGLRVRGTAGGGLSAVDADGQEVFTSPPALMWDSHTDTTGTAQPEQPEQSEQSQQPDPAGQSELSGQSAQSGPSAQSEGPGPADAAAPGPADAPAPGAGSASASGPRRR